MQRKTISVKEVADQCNLTGLKRVSFYIIAPFVAAGSFVAGYLKGYTQAIMSQIVIHK
jgi:hypothetical protein